MKTPHPHLRSRSIAGFTLVEIIVSLGIFSIVATVALGALVRIIAANKKAQTVQAAVTNLNFALDAMSREMRVGKNYYCVSGASFNLGSLADGDTLNKCPNGYSSTTETGGRIIAFNSSRVDANGGNPCNLITAYAFHTDDGGVSYSLRKVQQTACGNTAYPFTDSSTSILDPGVTITGYYVQIAGSSANPYSRSTVRISGYAGSTEKEKTYFDVQTTVSARVI